MMPGNIHLNFGEIRIFSFHPSQFARSNAFGIDGFAGWIRSNACLANFGFALLSAREHFWLHFLPGRNRTFKSWMMILAARALRSPICQPRINFLPASIEKQAAGFGSRMRKSTIKSKRQTLGKSFPVKARSRFPEWLPVVLLVLVTVVLYWPATGCEFVYFDDPDYVTANLHINGGLNWESVKWAFLNPVAYNWHPLTVMSHMLDCQLFGLNPWGHHLVNVLFHSLNAALVFALLKRLTGAIWRSLLVAGLFAFHPLHVESVAWVAERKDVLSGLFGLLALIFYTRYAQADKSASGATKARTVPAHAPPSATLDYMLALIFLTLGLLSKPMLVTWPFVMLLLDYWPLARFRPGGVWRLVKEKFPFFALAAVAGVVAFMVQKQGGAVMASEALPFGARIGNALVSYCRYLGKMIWPGDLAVYYPFPGYWPLTKVLLAGGLLAGLSLIFLVKRRQYPFLLMGWLWFCGMLVPVIGLVQVGAQAMADRYTYLPSLGVLILSVWGGYELTRLWQHRVLWLSVAGLTAMAFCMVLTRQQLGYWKDSETLFRHALAVTENNALAHNNLGFALDEKGQTEDAISQYQEAIRLNSDYPDPHNNLGTDLVLKGRLDDAISQYQEAIRLNPDYADAHYNLGTSLGTKGQLDDAISQFQEAIRLKPNNPDAHYNLGITFGMKGQLDDAISQYKEAIRLKPDYPEARKNLMHALELKNAPVAR